MNFICQKEAIEQLKLLAASNRHGVLIVGDSGVGKTYLARQYSNILGIPDFYIIHPVIADLKSTIDSCIENRTPVVLCIENLDSGVTQAAYPLLKLIEDCPEYIYIVVTCCNLFSIPDTIPSRCALISINPPTRSDIEQYAISQDSSAYNSLRESKLWGCVKGFTDVTTVLRFTPEQIKYFSNLPAIVQGKDTVSTVSWKLQHFDDNTETPLVLVIRYLLFILNGYHKSACIKCLNDLADNRISKNAIISKLAFELNYVR